MMLAVQARRRIAVADNGSPPTMAPVLSSLCSDSKEMVTISVVASPPWAGSRAGSRCSRRAQNA